ncbi:MAG: aminomethyl-transferring glycine dehydrogenase subunit GcvPB, partial [Methyloligellaceae bacterium]
MSMNRGGRPTSAQGGQSGDHPTFTGNKALQIEELLLFEVGELSKTGVDLAEPEAHDTRLGGLERTAIGLPGLSEPEAMRHYVR